jgi:hypothetical protein
LQVAAAGGAEEQKIDQHDNMTPWSEPGDRQQLFHISLF